MAGSARKMAISPRWRQIALFLLGRYNLLGWRRTDEEAADRVVQFRAPERTRLILVSYPVDPVIE